MNNVVVSGINPRTGTVGVAISYLACNNFCTPFLKYKRPLVTGNPLAADLVEPVRRH